MANNLSISASSGLVFLLLQSIAARLSGFIAQIVLAYILVPNDFGIIALASTVTTVISSLVGFGVDDVLLQRGKKIALWERTAFLISIGMSIFGMCAVFLIASFVSEVYRSADLKYILYIAALGFPINALSSTSFAVIKSNLNFSFLAKFGALEAVGLQVMIILLAWLGFGPYSFVIPAPIIGLLRAFVYRSVADIEKNRFRRNLFGRQWKLILYQSSSVVGSRLANNIIGQADYAILGFVTTSYWVGIYYFGYRLSAQPLRMLAGNFQSVLYPALVKLSTNKMRQADIAIEASTILSYITMPLFVLQAFLAPSIFEILFDRAWQPAALIFQILSIGLPFDAVAWVAGAYLNARGKFEINFYFSMVGGVIFVLFVFLFSYMMDAVGAAVGVSLFYIIAGPALTYISFREHPLVINLLIDCFIFCPILALISVGGAEVFLNFAAQSHTAMLHATVLILLASAFYVAMLRLAAPSKFFLILYRLQALRERRRAAWSA